MPNGDDVPRFSILAREECRSLLARNRVGRLAFARGNRVDIVPLHYVFADGVLCGRTAPGTHLESASHSFSNAWPAAFEVDEVDGFFDWRSVVVHGNVHAATPGDEEWRRDTPDWERTVRSLRTLIPETLSAGDPTAFRDVLIRLDVCEISGREARPALRSAPQRSVLGRASRSREGRRRGASSLAGR
jgi:uncharacterized protein